MILESKNLELAGGHHQEPMSFDALLKLVPRPGKAVHSLYLRRGRVSESGL